MSLRQFCGIWMGRSSAQGNSTGLPGESRWRTKASVIAREQFLSTFGQCNDSIISSWLGSAASAEQIERIAQANRRTISSFGEADRHLHTNPGLQGGCAGCTSVDGNKQSLQRRPAQTLMLCWRPCQRVTFFRALYRLKMYTGANPIRRYTC